MSSTVPDHVPTNIPPSDIRLPAEDWERVLDAARKSRSHNTKAAYRTYLSAWTRHAEKRGVPAQPAHPAAVAEWLTRLADEGKSISTMQVARAAIAAAHREAGLEDPTSTELVRRVLSGLSREAARQGRRPSQVKGLTGGDLRQIQAHFDPPGAAPPHPIVLRDLALVQVMRDGLLRRGEAANLIWRDIVRVEDGSGRLTIRHSKTDPDGKGAVMYLAPSTVKALERIRPASAQPHEKVFGLSGPYLSMRIKTIAERAGLGPGYSGHSCRIGMAQDLAAHGASLAQLMTAGRWTNPTMPALYTRNQAAATSAVAQYYQQLSLLNRHQP
ncbi:MAG: tyrosine-type recombinase/integrase [bacterium]|nr:site-specific integrase [Acidimicrobiia bacterium]MCY4651266.1 tyrosine-type recombinase/integrase [bacterium]